MRFLIGFFLLFFTHFSFANQSKLQKFEATIGATRLIYKENSKGETIKIKNSQTYPMLIQSKIIEPNGKENHDFIITPPLFKLDGGKETDVQIFLINNKFPNDRETLKRMCVRGIPPKADDLWNDIKNSDAFKINVSINTCIKFIVRPTNLPRPSSETVEKINWEINKSSLIARNTTPYYITLSKIHLNGRNIFSGEIIPPFSDISFHVNNMKSNDNIIEWSTIGDFGEDSITHRRII
ncbi:TPA: molecular chaperone [Escherichia coli]|uniref:fimbrial biogenesis chaperone n=1 Tax=Escherichia coli TaxID=562 RepID=UPI0037AA470F|nr:molecular chaperone [Escherichia coli]